MALSNWDTIAFDSDGNCCNGIFSANSGNSIEIYKNWVYFRSPGMWSKEHSHFTNETISQINSGDLVLGDMSITAIRGNQNGIYVYAECNRRRFAGIGCYGYRDRLAELLVERGIEDDGEGLWISGCQDGKHYYAKTSDPHWLEDNPNAIIYHDESVDGPYDYAADWTGVTKETIEHFITWLEELAEDSCSNSFVDWVKKVKNANHVRFNQGDKFFADHFGEPIPGSTPEESEKPILNKLLDHKE